MDNEIIDLLRTVANSFQMRMKEQIASSDAGPSAFQARLINIIGRHDSIAQLALGALTERDKAQIARAINELETAGLVTRNPNQADKRSKCLTLTPAGQEMHRHLQDMRSHIATEALSSLSDKDKQAFHTALQKVAMQLLNQG